MFTTLCVLILRVCARVCARVRVCVVSMCVTWNYLCCEYSCACGECVRDREKETARCLPVQIYERWALSINAPCPVKQGGPLQGRSSLPGAWRGLVTSPVCQVWRPTDRHKVREKPCRCRWKCPLCQPPCHCGCGRLFLPRLDNGEASMNYLPLAYTERERERVLYYTKI